MRKIVYGLAALAAIAIAMPSIASAEDMKDGRKEGNMKEGKMHHHMSARHHMYMRDNHHRTPKKEM
jgi:hypothetical protein